MLLLLRLTCTCFLIAINWHVYSVVCTGYNNRLPAFGVTCILTAKQPLNYFARQNWHHMCLLFTYLLFVSFLSGLYSILHVLCR